MCRGGGGTDEWIGHTEEGNEWRFSVAILSRVGFSTDDRGSRYTYIDKYTHVLVN